MAPKKPKYVPPADSRSVEEKLTAGFDYQFLPEPTRLLSVGDKVKVGSLVNAIVGKIFCGGKYYEIEYDGTLLKYEVGELPRHSNTFKWIDVFPLESKAPRFSSSKRDVEIRSSNTTIKGLVLSYYHFGIDMNPDYQRGYVWDLEDKLKLIDTIFKDGKIGLFVLNKLPYKDVGPSAEIVDGKQRLTAIIEFMEDKFVYQGYKWSELHFGDREKLNSHLVELAELNEANKETILKTFLKINRTGKPMDPSHLDKIEKMLESLKEEA
jgi:hypothetical protein